MENELLEALVQKTDSLERSLRRWRIAVAINGTVLAALAGFAAVIFVGYPHRPLATGNAEEVSAKRFVVVNSSGDTVATLGSWGDGTITGLVLQPDRAMTVESKEGETLLKSFVEPLAEKRGAGFFVTSDVSAIVLGGRKGKDGPDFGAGLSSTPQQANFFIKDGPDKNGRADNVSLGVMKSTRLNAQVVVSSRSGRNVNLTASDPYPSGKTEIAGEASITLSGPLPGAAGSSEAAAFPRETELALKSDGSAGLDFTGQDFATQAGFDIDKDGTPHLGLFDSDGERARLELDAQGKPSLNFFNNKSGEQRLQLGLTTHGDPVLSMYGKGTKTYGGTYLRDDGITLADEQGKVRAVFGKTSLEAERTGATETTAPGSLTLFDKNGRVIWQVPR